VADKVIVLRSARKEVDESSFRIKYAELLNPSQLVAVTHRDGPVLVIAGAGSGKTRTLIYRVARLIDHNDLLGVSADGRYLFSETPSFLQIWEVGLPGSPDDTEMFERLQRGMLAKVEPWVDISRGIGRERVDEDGSIVGRISDEVPQRAQMKRWHELMAAAD